MMLSHPNKKASTNTILLNVSAYLVRDIISVASGFVSFLHQLEGLRIGCPV